MSVVKIRVCTQCESPGIRDVNCVCVYDNKYDTIELEFEQCDHCNRISEEPMDSKWNAEQRGEEWIRHSPAKIDKLAHDEVFVFGSNLSGFHGAGAAKQALQWGARIGRAYGQQGATYAIPTKNENAKDTLPIEEIAKYVEMFILYARTKPERKFLVTEIGCGLAGLKVEDVAPLFKSAMDVENIYLPYRFVEYLTIDQELS